MKKIGLIVNPIAGMGGSVGLKGTDGEMRNKAIEMGSKPVTPKATRELVDHIRNKDKIFFLVAPKIMGEAYIKDIGISYRVIGKIGNITTSEDTKRIIMEMLKQDIDLLIFVGGDGTARDVYDVVGTKSPVVAVPSGVKMFSSVFAVNPRAAAEMVDAFIEDADITEREVMDIDEEAFRGNRLAARLYGYLKIPNVRPLLQEGKEASRIDKPSETNKEEIAEFIAENMEENVLYFLGPGTTLKSIADKIGVRKTLLGIDAVVNKNLLKEDVNEKDILELMDKYINSKIIVTPIGGNGFIFGRGSKQFTPKVLRRMGKENIIVVGSRDKITRLESLRVDTGDFEVDKKLGGYLKVLVGYKEEMVMEVKY